MEFLLPLFAVAIAICVVDWRRGLIVVASIGFGQDIIRKLTPGEPVYFVLFFLPFLMIVVIAALRDRLPLNPQRVLDDRILKAAILLYAVVVTVQILVGYYVTGSPRIMALGTIAYLFPVAGLLFATSYVREGPHFVAYLHWYVVFAAIMCIGIYLRVYGLESPLVDSVGKGLYIYPPEGGRLELPAGFFRSPEIAGWHAATAAMVISILLVAKQWRMPLVVGLLLIVFLVTAMLLTGRRKMIVQLVLFGFVFVSLMFVQRQVSMRIGIFFVIVIACIAGVDYVLWSGASDQLYSPYVSRSAALSTDLTDRIQTMLVDSFEWAHRRAGWFGLGAGVASQGAALVVDTARLGGGASEGGFAKVFVELGVQGCIAALLLVFAVVRTVLIRIRQSIRGELQASFVTLHSGMVAMLFANMCIFAGASQHYGDPFVLLHLGLFSGVVMAAGAYPQSAVETHYVDYPVVQSPA